MKILLDIVHPAHVHFFRHPIRLLQSAGHTVYVASRRKDCTIDLLEEFGISHHCLTTQSTGRMLGMAREMLVRDIALWKIARQIKPDVLAGVGGVAASQVSRAIRRPSIVFYDTEEARLQNALSYPFATRVVVPRAYTGWVPRRKQLRYRGYHELSYLHPNYFIPDLDIAIENGLEPNRDNFLIRLVSWKANHDIGLAGWDRTALCGVVRLLAEKGRVMISSESPLPPELESFAYTGIRSQIHHVMAHCRLIIGESATMASEAVVMGVPAIYAAPSYRGYISEQQARFGMAAFIATPTLTSISDRIEHFLGLSREEVRERYMRLLEDCIDVPKFIARTLVKAAH